MQTRRDSAIRQQPSLFDLPPAQPPLARKSDPQTSQQAATHAAANLSRTFQLFLDVLRSAVGPLTANEVGSIAAKTHEGVIAESIRKRARQLEVDGLIVVAGERKCTVTGNQAMTYAVKK